MLLAASVGRSRSVGPSQCCFMTLFRSRLSLAPPLYRGCMGTLAGGRVSKFAQSREQAGR